MDKNEVQKVVDEFLFENKLTNQQMRLLNTGQCLVIADFCNGNWHHTIYLTDNTITRCTRPRSVIDAHNFSAEQLAKCIRKEELGREKLTHWLSVAGLWETAEELAVHLSYLSVQQPHQIPSKNDYKQIGQSVNF